MPAKYKLPAEETISQIKAAGFAGTELGLNLPLVPWRFNRLLQKYELESVGGMWPTHLLTRPYLLEALLFRLILAYLRAMKASVVMVAEYGYSQNRSLTRRLFPSQLPHPSDKQWQKLGRGLVKFQKLAEDRGFNFGYHPHVGTVIIELWQIERLLAEAPELMLAIDTGHLAFAGVNPREFIDRYIDRIVHFHLKNVRPAVVAQAHTEPLPWRWAQIDGAFTVPGDGGIDFRPILEKIRSSGYEGWIVLEAEQNPYTANPYLYARLGRTYIKEVTGW
ncbi:MAG TPA: TIM barrel protein [Anaerolineae bacterium]